MQAIGVVFITAAIWFLYCGTHGLNPITLVAAIVKKPDQAGKIVEDALAEAQSTKYQWPTITSDVVNGAGDGATGGGVAVAAGTNPWANATVTAPYGQRGHAGTFGAAHVHQGIDYGLSVGTPLPAVLQGTAARGFGGLSGTTLTITGTGAYKGWTTIYMHLSEIVKTGPVVPGQIVAKSGGAKGASGSGDSTGPHLHFEVHHNGAVVNPATYWAWLAANKSAVPSPSAGGGGRPNAIQ